jgi:hypothetical protein
MLVMPRRPSIVGPDGSFTLGEFGDVMPGVYHIEVDVPGSGPGNGWWLRSASINGREVFDETFRVEPDQTSRFTAVLSLTDQHTSLSGLLETVGPRVPSEFTIIAFAADQKLWRPPFRRVRTTRPATSGQFLIHDLPPGDYYLAALTEFAPDDVRDIGFLNQIIGASIQLTIGPGEHKVQGLRMTKTYLTNRGDGW